MKTKFVPIAITITEKQKLLLVKEKNASELVRKLLDEHYKKR